MLPSKSAVEIIEKTHVKKSIPSKAAVTPLKTNPPSPPPPRHLPGTLDANFKTSFFQCTSQGLPLNIITQHHFKVVPR